MPAQVKVNERRRETSNRESQRTSNVSGGRDITCSTYEVGGIKRQIICGPKVVRNIIGRLKKKKKRADFLFFANSFKRKLFLDALSLWSSFRIQAGQVD